MLVAEAALGDLSPLCGLWLTSTGIHPRAGKTTRNHVALEDMQGNAMKLNHHFHVKTIEQDMIYYLAEHKLE